MVNGGIWTVVGSQLYASKMPTGIEEFDGYKWKFDRQFAGATALRLQFFHLNKTALELIAVSQ